MRSYRRKAKRPRLNASDIEKILSLYLQGKTTKEIIALTGRSTTSIYGVIKANRGSRRPPTKGRAHPLMGMDHTPRSE